MRALLDTHAVLWWLSDDRRLDKPARTLIADPANDVLISIASLWEIVVKTRIGKLQADFSAIERTLRRDRFVLLAITPTHLNVLTSLPTHHKDPFDHLLIAQAIAENAVFVSQDRHAKLYPVTLQRCGVG